MTKSSRNQKLFALAMALFLIMPVLGLPAFSARADAGTGIGASGASASEPEAAVDIEIPGPEVERLEGAYLYNFENDRVLFEYDSS